MLASELQGFADAVKIETRSRGGKPDYTKNKEVVLALPKVKGVYIIKSGSTICRVKGESDILYIGQGTIRSRIQALLRSLLPLPFRDYMNKHTAREAFERVVKELPDELQIIYTLCESSKDFETWLLQRYCHDHIEPPPLNNTRT